MLELGGVLEVMRPGHPTHVANKEMEVSQEAGWAVRESAAKSVAVSTTTCTQPSTWGPSEKSSLLKHSISWTFPSTQKTLFQLPYC